MTITIGFQFLAWVAWALAIVGVWYSGRCLERATAKLRAVDAKYDRFLGMRAALLEEVAQTVERRVPKMHTVEVPAREGVVQVSTVFRITAPKDVSPDELQAAFLRITRAARARGGLS